MPLEVENATEADARRAVEIEAIAYGPSPFSAILFPGPMPDNAGDERAEFLARELRDDPTTRWNKVIDTDLKGGQNMVAFCKWHVYTETPEPKHREFGQGCNEEACQMLFGRLQKQSIRVVGNTPYICEYTRSLHTGECWSNTNARSTHASD